MNTTRPLPLAPQNPTLRATAPQATGSVVGTAGQAGLVRQSVNISVSGAYDNRRNLATLATGSSVANFDADRPLHTETTMNATTTKIETLKSGHKILAWRET